MSIEELTAALSPMFQQITDRLDRLEKQLGAEPVADIRATVDALDVTRRLGAAGLKELARQNRQKERGH